MVHQFFKIPQGVAGTHDKPDKSHIVATTDRYKPDETHAGIH